MIATLFREKNYLVWYRHDVVGAGFDFAISSEKSNELISVEVKKLSSLSRVSIETVGELISRIQHTGVSKALLVSTTRLTSAAIELTKHSALKLCTLDELLEAKALEDLWQPKPETATNEGHS